MHTARTPLTALLAVARRGTTTVQRRLENSLGDIVSHRRLQFSRVPAFSRKAAIREFLVPVRLEKCANSTAMGTRAIAGLGRRKLPMVAANVSFEAK